MTKIDEIKQALAAATPGPWEVINLGELHIAKGYHKNGDKHVARWIADMCFENEEEEAENDAHLISKAPEYITYLLEENEKRLLEAQDWEDEYHALNRRYEELDKSALEKHELLMDTSAKLQAVTKELEEAVQAMSEPHKRLWFKLTNERNRVEEARQQVTDLRYRLEEARKILRFYADTKNYDQEKVSYDESDPLDCYYEAPEVQNDRGDRARAFLVGQEGEVNQ